MLLSIETKLILSALLVNILGGLTIGTLIGFVPIYTSMNNLNARCPVYLSEGGCNSAVNAHCIWLNESVARNLTSIGSLLWRREKEMEESSSSLAPEDSNTASTHYSNNASTPSWNAENQSSRTLAPDKNSTTDNNNNNNTHSYSIGSQENVPVARSSNVWGEKEEEEKKKKKESNKNDFPLVLSVPSEAGATSSEKGCHYEDYNIVLCGNLNETICKQHEAHCFFDYENKRCAHNPAWDAVHSGVFTGGLVAGGIISNIIAAWLITHLGKKRVLRLMGTCGCTGALIISVARLSNVFPLLVVGRVVCGLAFGLSVVVCPMYTKLSIAKAKHKGPIGATYAVCACGGLVLAAVVGYAVAPRDFYASNLNMEARIHGYNLLPIVVCFAIVPVSFLIPEDAYDPVVVMVKCERREVGEEEEMKTKVRSELLSSPEGEPRPSSGIERRKGREIEVEGSIGNTLKEKTITAAHGTADQRQSEGILEIPLLSAHDSSLPFTSTSSFSSLPYYDEVTATAGMTSLPVLTREATAGQSKLSPISSGGIPSWKSMIPKLLIAQFLALFFMVIYGIVSYATTVTRSLGIEPLLGNILISGTFLIGTLCSLPISRKVSYRTMFLVGNVAVTCSCLFVGVLLIPGAVKDDLARKAAAMAGILFFATAFHVGPAPAYYLLALEVFPPAFRSRGGSFTSLSKMILNLLVNTTFPVCVEAFSGGKSGNQQQGLSVIFLLFALLGTCTFIALFIFMKPFDDDVQADCAGGETIKKNEKEEKDQEQEHKTLKNDQEVLHEVSSLHVQSNDEREKTTGTRPWKNNEQHQEKDTISRNALHYKTTTMMTVHNQEEEEEEHVDIPRTAFSPRSNVTATPATASSCSLPSPPQSTGTYSTREDTAGVYNNNNRQKKDQDEEEELERNMQKLEELLTDKVK